MSVSDLWAMFYQRDTVLVAFLVGPLTALGLYAAHRLVELDDFLNAHPQIRQQFTAWKAQRATARICPVHKLYIVRGACPICGWRPK